MRVTGHKARSVSKRYNVVSASDYADGRRSWTPTQPQVPHTFHSQAPRQKPAQNLRPLV